MTFVCWAVHMLGWEESTQHFPAVPEELMWNHRLEDFIGKVAPCACPKSPSLADVVPNVPWMCVKALATSSLCTPLAIAYQKEHEEAVTVACHAINNGFAVRIWAFQWLEQRQLLTEGWIVQQQQTPGLSVRFGNCLITCTGMLTCDIKDYPCCKACILTVNLL